MVAIGRALMTRAQAAAARRAHGRACRRAIMDEIFEHDRRDQHSRRRHPDGRAECPPGAGHRRIAALCWRSGRNRFTGTGAELLADPEVAKSFLGGGLDGSERHALGPADQRFVFFINKGLIAGLSSARSMRSAPIGVTLIFGILRFAHFAAWRHDDGSGPSWRPSWLPCCRASAPSVGLPTAFVLLPVAMAVTARAGDRARPGVLRAAAPGRGQAGVIAHRLDRGHADDAGR